MSMNDPIADMLTRIRNALTASYSTVDIPSSKLKVSIANVLKSEGFIKNYTKITEGQKEIIRISIKYDENGEPVIGGLKRVSRPGRRSYSRGDRIPHTLGGLGVNILSTSKGIMTDKEARKKGVGGEVLCSVW